MRSSLSKSFLVLLLAAGLTGCGTAADPTTWWGDENTGPQPAELVELKNTVSPKVLWSLDTGDGSDGLHYGLAPHVGTERVYLADSDGTVSALGAKDGKLLWEVKLKDHLTGGPGAGDGLVLLGGADGQVIALDAENGKERWRTKVSSEVLSAPAAADGVVVARTGDGHVFGLDALDGRQRWRADRDIPVLTLRGNASPVISRGRALLGMEGGRLLSLDLETGRAVWETVITVPAGRTELERLADIDGVPMVLDRTVYVATYQGVVAAVGEASGRQLWQRKLSSYNGIGIDWRRVFVSDEEGTLWALDADSAEVMWSSQQLAWRGLSAPAVIGGLLVVGDFEGYLHFFDAQTGTPAARIRVGKERIIAAPVVLDGRLHVLGSGGEFSVVSVPGALAR